MSGVCSSLDVGRIVECIARCSVSLHDVLVKAVQRLSEGLLCFFTNETADPSRQKYIAGWVPVLARKIDLDICNQVYF